MEKVIASEVKGYPRFKSKLDEDQLEILCPRSSMEERFPPKKNVRSSSLLADTNLVCHE
jgi:hypothetical protein